MLEDIPSSELCGKPLAAMANISECSEFLFAQESSFGEQILPLCKGNEAFLALCVVLTFYCLWGILIIMQERLLAFLDFFEEYYDKPALLDATVGSFTGCAPEVFINLFSTSRASVVGISSILGGSAFAVFFLSGVVSYFLYEVRSIDWWPIARDTAVFIASMIGLISSYACNGSQCDLGGTITVYESVALLLLYVVYVGLAVFDGSIREAVENRAARRVPRDQRFLSSNSRSARGLRRMESVGSETSLTAPRVAGLIVMGFRPRTIGNLEEGMTCTRKIARALAYLLALPFAIMLKLVPDLDSEFMQQLSGSRKVLAALLGYATAVALIGALSFVIFYVVEVFARTVGIPEALAGYLILAICSNLVDLATVATLILAYEGDAEARKSAALARIYGSSIFSILVGLPLPWLINAAQGVESRLTTPSLALVTVSMLFLSLGALTIRIREGFNGTSQDYIWFIGLYIIFLTVAITTELLLGE